MSETIKGNNKKMGICFSEPSSLIHEEGILLENPHHEKGNSTFNQISFSASGI